MAKKNTYVCSNCGCVFEGKNVIGNLKERLGEDSLKSILQNPFKRLSEIIEPCVCPECGSNNAVEVDEKMKIRLLNIMSTLTPYEKDQIREIVVWERRKPSVLSELGGKILKPFSWMISKIVPDKVMKGALLGCNAMGALLADKGDILRDGNVNSIRDLQFKDLELSDKMANKVHNWAVGLATAEGATTGSLGAPGLLADIPTLMTLAYRTMHKIALCYGFECTSEEDKMFLNYIMSAANANTIEEKAVSILALQQINVLVAKTSFRKMAEKAAVNNFSKEAFVHFVRSFAKSLGYNLTRRKALQAIPLVGGAVGASMNAIFIQDVAWAARRSFQKRWLLINGKINESEEK